MFPYILVHIGTFLPVFFTVTVLLVEPIFVPVRGLHLQLCRIIDGFVGWFHNYFFEIWSHRYREAPHTAPLVIQGRCNFERDLAYNSAEDSERSSA